MFSQLSPEDQTYVQSALDDSCVIDVTNGIGEIVYVNQQFCDVSGYTKAELLGKTHRLINSHYHPPEFFEDLWQTLLSGKSWTGELRNRDKKGNIYWVNSTITPFLKDNPKDIRFVAVHKVVTKAKLDQLHLETTQRRFQEINFALNQTAIVAVTDISGVITYANEKFCEISKYKSEEIIGRTHQILNSGHHSSDFFKDLWKTISRGKIWRGEIKNRAKDDSYYWVDTTIIPYLDEKGNPLKYTAIRQEITERKEAEESLAHERAKATYAEKMASLGELSAGIAHELGNPLGAMRGRLEMLEMQASDPEQQIDRQRFSEILNKSIGLVDRMSKIIRGLRSYARDGSNDPKTPTSLNRLISDILDISNSKFHKLGIEDIRVHLDEDVNTHCREAEIGQVIVNLINNACDAVKDLEEKWVEIRLLKNQKHVKIQVIDSGSGITPEQQEKIFNPYYTTKPVGTGTGLGLSISQNIVAAHEGELRINKDVPNTCFELVLPLIGQKSAIQ